MSAVSLVRCMAHVRLPWRIRAAAALDAGRWLLLVDFCDRRIRTPWAWRCECNGDGLTDAAGAASGLRVHKDSLRVRLTHSAARNQACGLWLCRHPPVDDHGIHGCAGPVLNIRESSVRGGCASTRVA